jgi:hypothetical protein
VHRIGLSLRRVDSMAYADMDWQSLEDILSDGEDEENKYLKKPILNSKLRNMKRACRLSWHALFFTLPLCHLPRIVTYPK